MSSKFEQVQSILMAAIERPAEEWKAYLAKACGTDAELREQVDLLLRAHQSGRGLLDSPVAPFVATAMPPGQHSSSDGPGTMVGRYKLLQQVGEGGMGVVYMAEQDKPVRRRVALKIIKPGMDSQQVIARFEAERQGLAMMDHPNIARVLDAGCTDTGRPYFVMELVQGIPITKYCDDKQLDTRARLELFVQVCNAIQHAHQKGIIHRDLKPSNVLIAIYDGKPVPKIIDFGVAKALHQQLTEKTMFTQFGAVVGTLEYMSPEQADMDLMGTDTRSDIYSLGVLLYELLTGSTPMDGKTLRSLGYAEMLKTIREVEPPKPSTRLTQSRADMETISSRRDTEPRRLQKLVAGDLDWIVMKCLEKDRARRYETANGLAMDIQRHLHDEAVSASPPGQFYKLQKLVRRNKLICTATGCVMLALIIGLAASLWEANRATRAEAKAVAALSEETMLRQEAERRGSIAEAVILCGRGDFAGAEKLIDGVPAEFIEQDPTDAANVFRALGNWNGGEQRWKQAAADFETVFFGAAKKGRAVKGSDAASMDFLIYGPLLVETGDVEHYQLLYQSARLQLADIGMGERMLNTFLLLPIQDMHDDTFKLWAVQATQAAPTFNGRYACWCDVALGLLSYRQNDYDLAIQQAQDSLNDLHPTETCLARAHVVLAMAYARLNQGAEARSELAKCSDVIEAKFASHLGVGTYDSGLWKDWVIDRILLREAEALVNSLPGSTTDRVTQHDVPAQAGLPWALKLEAARTHFTMQRLDEGFYKVTVRDPKFTDCSVFAGSKIRRLILDTTHVTDLRPLADLPLEVLSLRETPITDVSPLRSLTLRDSLRELYVWKTKITDFSPIASCAHLERLDASDTALSDLSMVKGLKLLTLLVEKTKVADLTPVAGMPLRHLSIRGTGITDLSPLLQCPTLETIVLPQAARDVESLRTLPKLARLSFTSRGSGDPDKTAVEFWAEYDHKQEAATQASAVSRQP